MKRTFLTAICLSVVAAFAGPYDIDDFTATDAGSPDEYITAEFGGELKTAPADEVESLQDGRLVVRQKFEDPFGEAETTYQLYQGAAGDLSSMTALSVPAGTDYSDLVKSKIYTRKNMDAEKDVEKVYFDGKAVYVPGASSVFAYVGGSPVELKGEGASEEDSSEDDEAEETPAAAAPATAAAAAECDEYDPDCEDDDDDISSYKVSAPTDNTAADERDYSANDAAEDATDRFGIADEVRFWSGVALSAVAVAGAVMGVLQHMEANKAKDAYDDLDGVHSKIMTSIKNACATDANPGACEVAVQRKVVLDNYSIADLETRMKTNKDTQDSHAMARNIWFGVTGLSLTAAIVLFVW